MLIKAIIVDDELLAREMLQQMIQSLSSEIEIITLCSNLPDAVKAIHHYQPDLVFMDVDMPRYKGIEIDQFLPNIDFDLVFTTAHEEFALNAIKIGAIDYLLKPIDIDELHQCLKKVIQKKQEELPLEKITAERLLINTVHNIHLIDYKKILYFKAEGAYTKIVTSDGEIIASKNLKHYEDTLMKNKYFLRIHKSYIVNKTKINLINKTKQQAVVENNDIIQVAQDKLEKLLQVE